MKYLSSASNAAALLTALSSARFVVIIGGPASGKSTLAKSLQGFKVFHTDAYMVAEFDRALYVMIDDLKRVPADVRILVEGVQGYRLLRKIWQQNWTHKPDLVIHCVASREIRAERLRKRGSDPKKSLGMDALLLKVYNDWQQNKPLPQIIFYETTDAGK